MRRFVIYILLAGTVICVGCVERSGQEIKSDKEAPTREVLDERRRVALQRAIVELSKVKWIRFTNRPYELKTEVQKNGNYMFTFVMLDTPDQEFTAVVSSKKVVLGMR